MGKRVFQVRYRLRQQIVIVVLFVAAALQSYGQQQHRQLPVYVEGKMVGRVGADAGNAKPAQYYTRFNEEVFGTQMEYIIPVAIVGSDTDYRFEAEFRTEKKRKKDTISITLSNVNASEQYKFQYIKTNREILQKVTRQAFASYRYKIARDDYTDLPSTLICQKASSLKKNMVVDLRKDLFGGALKKNCFSCPLELSTEDCIKMKKEGKEFTWKVE